MFKGCYRITDNLATIVARQAIIMLGLVQVKDIGDFPLSCSFRFTGYSKVINMIMSSETITPIKVTLFPSLLGSSLIAHSPSQMSIYAAQLDTAGSFSCRNAVKNRPTNFLHK